MAENMDCPPPFTASNIAPPSYEGQSFEIPSGSRPLNELVFTLDTSKGKPWALLKVYSRGNKSSKVPTFMEGEVITGTVELLLDKVEHIQSVTVEVCSCIMFFLLAHSQTPAMYRYLGAIQLSVKIPFPFYQ